MRPLALVWGALLNTLFSRAPKQVRYLADDLCVRSDAEWFVGVALIGATLAFEWALLLRCARAGNVRLYLLQLWFTILLNVVVVLGPHEYEQEQRLASPERLE